MRPHTNNPCQRNTQPNHAILLPSHISRNPKAHSPTNTMPHPTPQDIDKHRQVGFRPGTVGCVLHEGKVLFVYHKEYNLWQLPQGGIDNGESLTEATMREMAEELGSDFAQTLTVGECVGDNNVSFPSQTQNTRELKTDAGETVAMKGKWYYFVAIQTTQPELDISKTEFDEYKWLSYDEALALAGTIYQSGKKRVTLDALQKLHNAGLLQ